MSIPSLRSFRAKEAAGPRVQICIRRDLDFSQQRGETEFYRVVPVQHRVEQDRNLALPAESSTSGDLVTTIRAAKSGPSVADRIRVISGFPLKSAISLLDPNRFPSPDAMITQPTGRTGWSKVIDIDIVSGTQGVEERRGLAAENSDHPLCIEQVENGITEFRAGAFKVAEFVDDGESGGRVDRPFYGSKTAAEKPLRSGTI